MMKLITDTVDEFYEKKSFPTKIFTEFDKLIEEIKSNEIKKDTPASQ